MVFSTLVGCNKVEEAGDLPGFWQLLSEQRKGVITNVKPQKVYWSERLGLMQFSTASNDKMVYHRKDENNNDVLVNGHLFAHVAIVGDSLRLSDFCYPSDYENDASDNVYIPFSERSYLFQWSIYPRREAGNDAKLEAVFYIQQLDNDKMILRSDSSTLEFRRY